MEIRIEQTNVKLGGRFDFGDPEGPVCAWSGCAVALSFMGTGISARIRPVDPQRLNNWVNAVVDGGEPVPIRIDEDKFYRLADNLPYTRHTVEVRKRTEAMEGELQFLNLSLPDGSLLEPPEPEDLRIEFIGDSYTCGYGNEASGIEDGYRPEQENYCLTYAALTARALSADASVVAWSGRGMYQNYGGDRQCETMAGLYGKTLPERKDSIWTFKAWMPHAVVINLGTNDFSADLDQDAFRSAYKGFVNTVRAAYPEALIFCTIMDARAVPAVSSVVRQANDAGDRKVYFLKYSDQDIEANGIGGDWHPSAKTHAVMAEELLTEIRKRLQNSIDDPAGGN